MHQADPKTSAHTSAEIVHSRLPRMRYVRSHRGPWFQCFHPTNFEWNIAEIEIFDLPDTLQNFRILHLTDMHLRGYWSPAYDVLLDKLRADPPDLLLITGDFVDDLYDPGPALPTLERFLNGLSARHGVYGIRGNHDLSLFGPPLETSHLKLIEGKQVAVHVGNAEIDLIGLPGLSRELLTPDVINGVPKRMPHRPRLVLSHYPDQIKHLGAWQADVFLAGHTHGGQMCLPFGFAPHRNDSLPHRYCKGIHRLNRTWLCVGRGLGFSTWPIRVFCPAEVVELRLVRELK